MSIPFRDLAALRALDCARRAVEVSDLHQLAVAGDVPDPVHDQVCRAFTELATAHLGADVAVSLFECLLNTGDDVEECLAIVTNAPQIHVVVAGDRATYRVDRVCWSFRSAQARAAELEASRAFEWVNIETVDYDGPEAADEPGITSVAGAKRMAAWLETLQRLPAPQQHDGVSGAYLHAVATPTADEAELSPVPTWDYRVELAVRNVFPSEAANTIIHSDAFGALVYRVRSHCEADCAQPADVLSSISGDDRAFACRADDPAAFLASRVAQL